MEKESIVLTIKALADGLVDRREFTVQATRGEIAKYLDEVCADIQTSFDQ
jgi:hypothetical protein